MPTIQQLAEQLAEAFEVATRATTPAEPYTRLKDGSPDWMTNACHAAHDDMFPDNWRYEAISDAAAFLAGNGDSEDAHDFADSYTDILTHTLTAWLGSHSSRPGYCDEAVEEFGQGDGGIIAAIQAGQYVELSEVYNLLRGFLADLAENNDEDQADE